MKSLSSTACLLLALVFLPFLLYVGHNIARHNFWNHVTQRPPRNCLVCALNHYKRKMLTSLGRTLGRIRAKIKRFGKPTGWNLDLPMYQETNVMTPHVLNDGQRPDLQLLVIPYDIRRIIYLWLLKSVVALDCSPTLMLQPNELFLSLATLLRVCRQTREEFLPLFYGQVLFSIYPRYPFYRFYRHLGWPAIHGLREIHLSFDNSPTMIERCWNELRDARNVREIYITFKHIDAYLACVPYLDLILLESRTRPVRPDLALFQIMVECPTWFSFNHSDLSNSVRTATRAHIRAARYWEARTVCKVYFKPGRSAAPGRHPIIPRLCTRIMRRGYQSSLDQRCRELGVENPMWEIPT